MSKKRLCAVLCSFILSIQSISVFAEDTPPGNPPSGKGGPDTQSYDYTGSYTGVLSADGSEQNSTNETVSAAEKDQNALLARNGGTLTITDGTIEKTGEDTDGDACNFYGVNSIALSSGSNSLLKIQGSSLTSDSEGSNAVFATDVATAYVYDSTISTSKNNSRGLDATYAGNIVADNLNITTQGDHSAAIATDRGGGNVSITNSLLYTSGSGSPLLYSTGDIEADAVQGTASGSQIAGLEGYNKILIYNSNLASTNNAISGSDPVKNGVIIYQSTSGDADTSTNEKALFEVADSTLSTCIDSGAMFYVTNTNANILISNSLLSFDADNVNLLQATGNSSNTWGKEGSNGGTVTLTAIKQNLSGNILVDSISSADIYLLSSSSYTGNTASSDSNANISMNISSDSVWYVTDSCALTNLNVEDGGKLLDINGNTVTVVQDGKTITEGDSTITVTVTGQYSTTVTTDSDNVLSTDYIDRSAFDSTYGTSTAFSTNQLQKTETTSTPVSTFTSDEISVQSSHTKTIVYACVAGVCILAGILFYTIRKIKKH